MERNEDVVPYRPGNRQGKRRIQIERQPTDKKRNATFLNRRDGLLKKARELATLCHVDVALIMFTPRNELYEFSSNTEAHILHQYLVKKQGQGQHTEPELLACYYMLAHVEALEHEANRNKYNIEVHWTKIDPRLRKFTLNDLQIMSDRNLLNKFQETVQHNQRAILEYYEKQKKVGVSKAPIDEGKAKMHSPIHQENFAGIYQPPQVPNDTYNYHRTSGYVNEATLLTMDGRQDLQWANVAPGPPGYVVNRGQFQQSQHQVQEAYNMLQQSMMQQPREFELLMATMKRERELLRYGESSLGKEKVAGWGGLSRGDTAQVAPRCTVAQGPQGNLAINQHLQPSYPYQTQHDQWNNQTHINSGHYSWPQHATAKQASLAQQEPLYQPPMGIKTNQGQDFGAQRPQEFVTNFQNMSVLHPDQAQEDDSLGEHDLEDILKAMLEEDGNYQATNPIKNDGDGEVGASDRSLPSKVGTRL